MMIPMKFKIIAAIGLAACVGLFVWHYKGLREENASLRLQRDSAREIIKRHEENTIITEEVSYDYQKTINQLNVDIERLRKRPARCITVTSPTSSVDAATTRTELSERDGLRSEWLLEFAGRCERERLKVMGLQNFINRIYE